MRTIAHSRGGRHRPNYQAGARIRPADIDRAHTITMKDERAQRVTAPVPVPRGFVAMPARRARLRAVALADDDHLHPQPLGFVGEHVPHLPTGHLVDALVAMPSVSGVLADIPDVAHDDGLHPALVEGADKVSGLFVQGIAQLMWLRSCLRFERTSLRRRRDPFCLVSMRALSAPFALFW